MTAARPTRHLSRAGAVVLGALALSLLVSHLAGQTASAALQVLTRDGRRTLAITTLGSQDMLALDELAAAFQLTVRDDGGAITVAYKGRSVVLTPDQTIASVAGRLISLPAAPVRNGNRWFVPLDFVSRALGPIYDTRLELRRPSRLLIVGELRVPRVMVRHEAAGSSARVTFEVSPAAATAVSQQGQRLLVRFDADAIDVTLPVVPPQGDVQTVRLLDATNIAIDLGPRFTSYRASTQPSDTGTRLVVDIVGAAEPAAPAPAPAAPAPVVTSDAQPMLPQGGASIRTVAIDAGHGGDDTGAKGAAGTLEKDVTLDAARRLKSALEARLGLRVIMTRDDDRTVPVENRSAVANNNKADLFISLHTNASVRPTVRGAQVLSLRLDDYAGRAGTTDTASIPVSVLGGGTRVIEVLPWETAQIGFTRQSAAVADILKRQLAAASIPILTTPSSELALRPLVGVNMPAVLIELGMLSNADDERELNSTEVTARLIDAILSTIGEIRQGIPSGDQSR